MDFFTSLHEDNGQRECLHDKRKGHIGHIASPPRGVTGYPTKMQIRQDGSRKGLFAKTPFLYRKGDGEDIEYPKNNRSSLTPGTVTRVSRELVSQITTLDSPLGMRKPTARFKSLPPSPFL